MDSRVLAKYQLMLSKSDSLFGEEICINGIATTANVSSLKYSLALELGGFEEKIGLSIVLNKAQSITPVIGQIVNYKGKKYRVFQIDSDCVSYTFGCESINI